MNEVVGRGGFGVVRRAQFQEVVVAVKCLRSDEHKDLTVACVSVQTSFFCSLGLMTLPQRLVREMKIWSGLRHQNILPLIGFYLSPELDEALIVCRLEPRGSLWDFTLQEKPSVVCRLRLVSLHFLKSWKQLNASVRRLIPLMASFISTESLQ